jgi:hypothetical protein
MEDNLLSFYSERVNPDHGFGVMYMYYRCTSKLKTKARKNQRISVNIYPI